MAQLTSQPTTSPSLTIDRMEIMMEQYADRPMDFADASLVVLAEHLGHGQILTVDRRDFDIYRWNGNQSFTNLFF